MHAVPCSDNAHNWNASYPSANFDDTLVAGVRKGDVLTRKLDSTVYEIVRVVPNGFGRTTGLADQSDGHPAVSRAWAEGEGEIECSKLQLCLEVYRSP
jgi:hypothetical protein